MKYLTKKQIKERLNDIQYKSYWIECDYLRKYRHDCDSCFFLGALFDDMEHKADIYICSHTIIFRISDEPSEKWSMNFRGSVHAIFSDSAIERMGFAIYCALYLPDYDKED